MKVVLSAVCKTRSYAPTQTHYCNTIKECCMKAREYIKQYNVPCWVWKGGAVYIYDKFVGHILYNGNFVDEHTHQIVKCPTPPLRSKYITPRDQK